LKSVFPVRRITARRPRLGGPAGLRPGWLSAPGRLSAVMAAGPGRMTIRTRSGVTDAITG